MNDIVVGTAEHLRLHDPDGTGEQPFLLHPNAATTASIGRNNMRLSAGHSRNSAQAKCQ